MGKQTAKFKFGKRVKTLRKDRGWTQIELARRAKISRSYLQKIESQQPPDVTIDTIVKLACGLKINCYEILK